MPNESMEAPVSSENGNVSVEFEPSQEAPVTPPVVENELDGNAPAASEQAVPPVETPVTEELYELPDGRKVDAATLSKEWKDNFLPEFTRKSQILAQQQQPITNNPAPAVDPKDDPNSPQFVPKTYAELIQIARDQAIQSIKAEQQSEQQRVQAAEEHVASELNAIKATDPGLNENALFLHANKYGFTSLPAAYQNMKDMAAVAKTVSQQTQRNIQQRAADPVSTTPGQSGGGTPPNPSAFQNARDYLRSIGGK